MTQGLARQVVEMRDDGWVLVKSLDGDSELGCAPQRCTPRTHIKTPGHAETFAQMQATQRGTGFVRFVQPALSKHSVPPTLSPPPPQLGARQLPLQRRRVPPRDGRDAARRAC